MIDLHQRPSHEDMSLWVLLEQGIYSEPEERDLPTYFQVVERRDFITASNEEIL